MAASVSGSIITFTGTNTSLSDLTGLSGVSRYGSATGKFVYRLSSRQIKFASGASLIIDPDFEEIVFEANCPSPEIDYAGGTLQIGRKRTVNGKTRYSSGTAITITRQSATDAQTNSIGGIIQDGNGGTFIGYGGWIHTAAPTSFCGKLNGNRTGSVLIESLGLFGRLVGDGKAPQVRFDNSAGQSVNVRGLVLDCDPNILDSNRSIILFSQDFTSFSATFKSFSFQSFTSQPFGLRLDNLAFNENFRPSDLVANGGGEAFVIANSDKGSSANIAIQTNSACHFGFYGTANIVTLDENGDPLGDCNYYIEDENRGGRFAPIGNTSLISSLMGVYGSAGNNIYNGRTNAGTGEASETILLSTWRTDGSGGFDHEDYSNGGGLADVMDVVTYKYGYLPSVLSPQFRQAEGPNVIFESKVNISITQQNKSIVDNYTTLDNANQLHDRSAADLDDLYAGERVLTLGIEGTTILGGSKNFIINSSGAAYNLSGSTVTLRSNNYSSGISTTGTVTLQGSSVVSSGTFTCNVITQSGKTFTDVTIPSGNVLQVTSGGTVTLDSSDVDTVQNASGQQVNVVLINGASIPNLSGGNIAVINNMTVNFNGLQTGDALYVRDNNGNTQDFINVAGTSQQITINRSDDGETWGYGVKRLGFAVGLGTFDVAEGTTLNINISLIQQLTSGGSPLYTGSTTALMSVEINPDGSSMRGLIGNGAVSAQQYYDVTEAALMSENGLSYLFNGGGACTFSQTPTGTFLSLQDNYQVKRRNAGDDSATVNAFVTSTQGTFLDSSNNTVQLVTVTTAQQLTEYDGFIWVDLIGGVDEFVYPAGTPTRKVNSIANAITLGEFYGINKIKISGDETTLSQEADGYEIVGDVTTTAGSRLIPKVTLSSVNGANNSIFKDLIIDGATNVSSPVFGNKFDACVINGLTGLTGIARSSKLAGILTVAYDLDIIDCFGTAALNVVGADSSVSVPNFSGQLTIAGMTNPGATVSIGVISGVVIVDSSCTAGSIVIANADSVINNGNGVTVTEINDSSGGGSGGGGDDAATIYTYFTTSNREDAFKATGFSTFNASTDSVTVSTNNDKSGYSLANNSITSSTIANNAFNNNTFTTGFYNQVRSQVDAELTANHGSGSWVEATGFATPSDVSSGFDEIKGVGWTDETLKDIRDNLGTGGTTPQQVYDYFVAGSREDVFKADISGVATTVQLNAARDSVISEVNDNEAKIDILQNSVTNLENISVSDIRTELATELSRLDVDVSSVAYNDTALTALVNTLPTLTQMEASAALTAVADITGLSTHSAADVVTAMQAVADQFKADVSGLSTFNVNTDEVTTDNASRVASRATGFATPSDVNSTQSAIISAIGNLNNLSAAQVTAAVPSTAQIEAALINEGDGQQLIDAIVTLINSNLDLPALELAAIASQVRVELSTELSRIDRNLSTLSTFNASTDEVTVVTNNDKTGYSLANNSITSSTVDNNAFSNNTFTTGFYNQIGSEVDNSLSDYDVPTRTDLNSGFTSVLNAISALPDSGSISGLLQKLELLEKYHDNTTAYLDATGTIEVEQKDAYFTVVYDNDGTTELKRIAFQNSLGAPAIITEASRYVKV